MSPGLLAHGFCFFPEVFLFKAGQMRPSRGRAEQGIYQSGQSPALQDALLTAGWTQSLGTATPRYLLWSGNTVLVTLKSCSLPPHGRQHKQSIS